MLTRAQVAHRLGKSIATVRRLEGSRLHPRRDAAGIHRFDPGEVMRLAAELGLSGNRGHRLTAPFEGRAHTPAQWLRRELMTRGRPRDDDEPPSVAVVDERTSVGSTGTTQLVARVRELEERLSECERASTVAKRMAEQQQAVIAEDVIQTLMSLSDRELRRLPADLLEQVAEALGQVVNSS